MNSDLTILLPTYNRSERLQIAVNSVLNQRNDNFRLIIFDNASTDATRDYLRSLRDRRIQIFFNKKNVGMVRNVNLAIRSVKRGWLTFLCDDDYLAPDFTEVMNKGLAKTSARVYLASSMLQDENGTTIGTPQPNAHKFYSGPEGLSAGIVSHSLNSAGLSGYAIETSLFGDIRRKDIFRNYPGGFFSDTYLFFEAVLRGSLEATNSIIYHKVNWSGSATGGLNVVTWRMAKHRFISDMVKLLRTNESIFTGKKDILIQLFDCLQKLRSDDIFGKSSVIMDYYKYIKGKIKRYSRR
ncbi:MAG: glycosyltransferase family 2 protein [Turneriella sp.]|nr:glycosyltransferase family 2 protein [Turneriella sp.]